MGVRHIVSVGDVRKIKAKNVKWCPVVQKERFHINPFRISCAEARRVVDTDVLTLLIRAVSLNVVYRKH